MQIFDKDKGQKIPLELIKIAAHEGLTIVSKNFESIKAIRIAATEMDLVIPQPISYYDFTRCHYPATSQPAGFLIQNVDVLLQKYGDALIVGCSFSK